MSLLRPIKRAASGSQGAVTQPFLGAYTAEPAGYVRWIATSYRGRRSRFTGSTYHRHVHLAIDYSAAIGTPVYAVADGKIMGQGRDSSGAYFLYLRVRRGLRFQMVALYYHLQAGSFKYKIGDSVRRGAVVALSGNTGRTTGPHLHFALIRGYRWQSMSTLFTSGMRFDPQPFINGTALLSSFA